MTSGTGTVIRLIYDGANRLTERVVQTLGSDVSTMATREVFTYDAVGRMLTAETFYGFPPAASPVKVTRTFDSVNRSLEERYAYLGATPGQPLDRAVATSYAIPGGGEDFLYRRGLTYPSGHVLSLTPDRTGKLSRIDLDPPGAEPQRQLAAYRYAGQRPLERRLFLSTATTTYEQTLFSWDGHRRLETLTSNRKTATSTTEQFRWELLEPLKWKEWWDDISKYGQKSFKDCWCCCCRSLSNKDPCEKKTKKPKKPGNGEAGTGHYQWIRGLDRQASHWAREAADGVR